MFKLPLSISKRQKFVISAFLLSAGLLVIQISNVPWRYQAIGALTILTFVLSAWALSEGLNGIEWLTVLILPTLFTAGVGLFYFLIPSGWITRIPVIISYSLGLYALLLTENIFSVAAIRTIQLLRSAQAVGFLLTLATSFFLYDTIFSFKQDALLNFLFVALVTFPLALQGLWSIKLDEKIPKKIWLYSVSLTLCLAEMALVFSFWPVSVAVGSLALTTVLYLMLGLSQHDLNERLFQKTVNEYIGVGISVLLIILLTTHWRG